jgi:hypothetical protein
MASVVVNGDTSGAVTLSAPAVAGTVTVTLPSTSGTMLTTASTAVITQAMLSTNVAGNGPAFSAYQSSSQSISATTATKITLDAEIFDTNSNFASSRFTPTVAGYYHCSGGVMLSTVNTTQWVQISMYKNGAEVKRGASAITGQSGAYPQAIVSGLLYLNGTSDYVEIYVYTNAALATNPDAKHIYFDGFLARTA